MSTIPDCSTWNLNGPVLPEVPPVEGPHPPASPSVVISEMLGAAGEEGLEKLRLLAELVFSSGEIAKDWEESLILNLYKGNGEALDRGNYRGLKLTDQVMKLLERVLDSSLRKMVNIDDMQFGSVPGRAQLTPSSASGEVLCRKQTTLYCLCRPRKGFQQSYKKSTMVGSEECRC